MAQVFVGVYPNIDVLLVQADGKVLAQVGCETPPADVMGVPEMAAVLKGAELKAVVDHGCESPTSAAPAAYTIGVPLPGVGAVFTCMPVDAEYLKNASSKLGLELALAVLGGGEKVVGATQEFPSGAVKAAGRTDTTIIDAGDRSWAVQRFEPRQLERPARQGGHGGRARRERHPLHRPPEPALRARRSSASPRWSRSPSAAASRTSCRAPCSA